MDADKTINTIAETGKLLLQHGAEIYRVEESMERLLYAYGFINVEVFAIPTYLSISATTMDHETHTIIKRSRQNRINLDAIYMLNNIIRDTCTNPIAITALEEKILHIEELPLKMHLVFLGYGISSGFFVIFFGGNIQEAILGGSIGFAIYFIIWLMEILEVNTIVTTLLASMALATLAILLQNLHMITNIQAVTTGCLMVLVPGVAITNSLRDIIGGEYVSGIARMVEAILIAVSIATGVGSMMLLLGG